MPGASVTLTQKAKGLLRRSATDESGSFLFPFIEPGAYEVQVIKEGFALYEIDDLTIDLGQSAGLQIPLRIGDSRSAIGISASAQIETESNTLGSVVDSRRVEKLPLDGRTFWNSRCSREEPSISAPRTTM